ncbi:hypothetical protein TeGR_g11838 [Tetraparma gracilis]|nr:hypothetical protein TeGR_g11838 [Tetraparma gracilis]
MLAISLCVIPGINMVLHSQIKEQLVVDSSSSPSYTTWVSNADPASDSNLDVTYDVYMWSVANPSAVLHDNAKPQMVQMGPYSYKEYFNRFNVSFSDDGEEVSFYEQWYYVFDEAASGVRSDTEDEVTQANLVMHGLRALLSGSEEEITDAVIGGIQNSTEIPNFEKTSLISKLADMDGSIPDLITKAAMCLTGGSAALDLGPFHVRSPKDLYFGYDEDPTLGAIGDLLSQYAPSLATNWSTASPGLSANSSTPLDTMRTSNVHTIYTGKGDLKKLGKFKYYANMTNMYVCPAAASNCDSTPPPPCYDGVCYCHLFQHEWTEEEAYCHGYLPMWANPDATAIAGTDATQTGEFPMKDDIQVFISDLYRSSKLKYFGDKDDFHGITLRRYGIDPIDLENAFANVSQADFFQWGYKGMENMSVAAGLPLFATKPHFLDGDPDLVNGVAGMNPSEDAHDTYVDFEPITGVAFRAAKRLQVATEFTHWKLPVFKAGTVVKEALKLKGLAELVDILDCLETDAGYAQVPGENATYIPYGWADEYYTFSDDDADEFKASVYGTQDLAAQIAIYCGVAAGVGLLAVLTLAGHRKWVRGEAEQDMREMMERERDGTTSRWTRIGGSEGPGSGASMRF